jgi:hypothetical protein
MLAQAQFAVLGWRVQTRLATGACMAQQSCYQCLPPPHHWTLDNDTGHHLAPRSSYPTRARPECIARGSEECHCYSAEHHVQAPVLRRPALVRLAVASMLLDKPCPEAFDEALQKQKYQRYDRTSAHVVPHVHLRSSLNRPGLPCNHYMYLFLLTCNRHKSHARDEAVSCSCGRRPITNDCMQRLWA